MEQINPQSDDTSGCNLPSAAESHRNITSLGDWRNRKKAAAEVVEVSRLWAIKTWREREEHAAALEGFEDWCQEQIDRLDAAKIAD